MDFIETEELPSAISKLSCNLVEGSLYDNEMVNGKIQASPGGGVIGISFHQVLNKACRLTHSPLPRDHGATSPLKGVLLHQVSPKGAMVLPDH